MRGGFLMSSGGLVTALSLQTRPFRVCVTGAECTGKTSLANALGRALDAPVVHEVARDYFAEKAERGDRSVYASDIVRVVDLQREVEAHAPTEVPLVIFDTDVLTTAIWQTRYFGERNIELLKLAHERQSSEATRMDVYLLCEPDIPFEHDCVRGSSEERDHMHTLFHERLTAEGWPFVRIKGTFDERLASALDAVLERASLVSAQSPPAR